jgi:concanavalin A-like lectin/glucanase superfamily protein
MTATLFIIVPVALLVLVGTFYFVGCKLDTQGLEFPPFTEYGRRDVLENTSLLCIAYWPLKELPGAPQAIDLKGGHNGDYKNAANSPKLFPCPDFTFPNGGPHSAAAGGTLILGQTTIVDGETKPPHDPNDVMSETGMTIDGGFVIVPATEAAALNPAKAFSVEVWARAEFSGSEVPALRMVIESRDRQGPASDQLTGFAIWANNGIWEGVLGIANSDTYLTIKGSAVTPEKATHLVLTFDGENGTLFVNGAIAATEKVKGFMPNTTQPLTMGVGLKRLDDRDTTDPLNAEPRFPLLPFNGTLQCVAIYGTALLLTDVQKHFHDGQGLKDEENA